MRRAVLLGGTGFIGRALTRELEARGLSVDPVGSRVLDLAQAGAHLPLAQRLGEDVLLLALFRASSRVDPWARFSADMAMATNVARAVESRPPGALCFLSSTAVYGNAASDLEVDENTPPRPDSLYGASKACAEDVLRLSATRAAVPLSILRPGMVYGPGDESEAYGPARLIRQALAGGEIELYGDGSEVRDNLYVDDLARMAASLGLSRAEGLFVAGSGEPVSFRRIVELLEPLAGRRLSVRETPRRTPKTDQGLRVLKLRAALKDLKITPLKDGLALAFRAAKEKPTHA